jgi:hypothetical protein
VYCSEECRWLYWQQYLLQLTVQIALLTPVCSAANSANVFTDSSLPHPNCSWGTAALIVCCAAYSVQSLSCNREHRPCCGMQSLNPLFVRNMNSDISMVW